MKRKSILAKGMSWLLVTAMLVTGSAAGFVLPAHAAGDGIESTIDTDENRKPVAEDIQNTEKTGQDEEKDVQLPAEDNQQPGSDEMGTDIEEGAEKQPDQQQEEQSGQQPEVSQGSEGNSSTEPVNEVIENDDVTEGSENAEEPVGITIVKSPVVNAENHSITFNLNGVTGIAANAKKVLLRGDVIDDWDVGLEMVKEGDVYTVTVENVNPGVYTYKYVIDGAWHTDPHNPKTVSTADGANSVVYMPGLSSPSGSISVMKGNAKVLPATLKYYDNAGNFTEVPVTYSLEAGQTDIELNGDSVTVNKEVGTTAEVIASYEKDGKTETAKVKLSVVDEIYTYNIYYYDFEESRMTTSAAQLWLWEYKVSGESPMTLTSWLK